MVATALTEHSYWLAQALAFLAVFIYATQVIAFEWKPGLSHLRADCLETCIKYGTIFSLCADAAGRASNLHFIDASSIPSLVAAA